MKNLFSTLAFLMSISAVWAPTPVHAQMGAPVVLGLVGKDFAPNELTSKGQSQEEWAREACGTLHKTVALSFSRKVNLHCVWLRDNEMINPEVQKLKRKGDIRFQVELRELRSGGRILRLVDMMADSNEIEPTQTTWRIKKEANLVQEASRLLANALRYFENSQAVRDYFLAKGSEHSKRVAINDKAQFVDRSTGLPISSDAAMESFVQESPKNKNYLRAGLEIAALLGAGQMWYRANLDHMMRDWDFGDEGQASKFRNLNGFRFDDNSFDVNRDHAWAGVAYYLAARGNGLTSMESFLATFAASSIWEFMIEHREVVSINDQIFTPIGGFVIGETLHQLGKVFRKPGSGFVKRSLGAVVDPGASVNQVFDRLFNQNKGRDYGYNMDIWSSVDLEAAIVRSSKYNETGKMLAFRGQVVNIPMYEEPGHIKELITDTTFSEMVLKNTISGEPNDFFLFAKTAFAAYYEKNMGADKEGNLTGYNFFIGPASAVEFQNHVGKNGKNDDFMGIINVLGGTMHLTYYSRGLKITATVDVYGDFAMVRPTYIIDRYFDQTGKEGLPSVLQNQDYYYATGITSRGQVVVEYGRWAVGAALTQHELSSINSGDRYKENLTRNPKLSDSRFTAEASVTYKVSKHFHVKFAVERRSNRSKIEGFGSGSESEKRYYGALIFHF